MSTAAMRFSRVYIEGLFGPSALPIEIDLNLKHRVTILHGRNGSGKTITLSLLLALRSGRFDSLAEVPFERLRVEMTDGACVQFERKNSTQRKLRYSACAGGVDHPVITKGVLTPPDQSKLRSFLAGVPWLRQVGEGQWVDDRMGDLLSTEDAYRLAIQLQGSDGLIGDHGALRDFCESFPPVKFVRADRLFAPPGPHPSDIRHSPSYHRPRPPVRQLMVERLSQDIRGHVQAADRQYRLASTQLDSALRNRLVDPTVQSKVALDELKKRYAALAVEETRLRELGLFPETSPPVRPDSFSEQNRNVLAILLEDNEKKLDPFKKLADRAQRLLDTLNKKLAPKSVRLDVESGYHVASADGRPLPLDKLSSGEQHELVLLHELLFEAEPGSLILIDEPELSLHPTWQQEFLPDLLAIAEVSELDFVLATHSPYIINGRTDLMVRLGAPFHEHP